MAEVRRPARNVLACRLRAAPNGRWEELGHSLRRRVRTGREGRVLDPAVASVPTPRLLLSHPYRDLHSAGNAGRTLLVRERGAGCLQAIAAPPPSDSCQP